MTLEHKTILVTGANRGIGQALVADALSRGAERVYAGTHQPLIYPDGRVTPLMLDVTDTARRFRQLPTRSRGWTSSSTTPASRTTTT